MTPELAEQLRILILDDKESYPYLTLSPPSRRCYLNVHIQNLTILNPPPSEAKGRRSYPFIYPA